MGQIRKVERQRYLRQGAGKELVDVFKVMPAGRYNEVLGIWWGDVKRGGRSGRNRL